MSLILTEEQKMLKDSAREFLEINSPLESFRTLRDNDYKSYDSDVWRGFVEMGNIKIHFFYNIWVRFMNPIT